MVDPRSLPGRRPTRAELGVFVAGTASLGLEVLAGRLLAPSFGSGLFVWGSVIGVTLVALALGYHHGGRTADGVTHGRLSTVLLAAAGYVGVVVVLHDPLLRFTAGLSLPSRFAPLVPVAAFFGPPTYLLGLVSPYAAELSDRESVGAASGHVYAVGTVGSIVGAFATTFLLLPALDVTLVGLALGGLLVAASVGLSFPSPSPRTGLAVVLVVAVVGTSVVGTGSVAVVDPRSEVVYETQSAYQQIRVVDRGGVRTLYLDGVPHSAMDLDDPSSHVFTYTEYFHLPLLLRDDVDRVLFVGGGGFSGPRAFTEAYDVTVDVVEIDPAVVRTAKRYFGVEESARLRIHTTDGRRYLRRTDREYDLIVLDAYRTDAVPYHLTTVEFVRLARSRLDGEGVLLANVIASPEGPGSAFYRAQYRTMDRVFPQVYSFPVVGGRSVQNIELVATRNATRVTETRLRRRAGRRSIGPDLRDEVGRYRYDVAVGDAPVLRDDRATVDDLLGTTTGRRYVVERENASGYETQSRRPSPVRT